MPTPRALASLLTLVLAPACASEPAAAPVPGPTPTASARAPVAPSATASARALEPDAGALDAGGAAPRVAIGPDEAAALLFGEASVEHAGACAGGDDSARTRCLVELAYAADARAKKAALELWDSFGGVAGRDRAWTMDGGYRGRIEIQPEYPVGPEAKHLEWVVGAAREADAFFAAVRAALGPDAGAGAVRYRHRDLRYKFFRSKAKRTPTAYAEGWSIAYNLAGSLNRDQASVTETLFHETFHLNDADHGGWSEVALGAIHAGIVAKCGAKTSCLAAYAPNATMVKGGTFYAFHGGNGPGEYAAELAVRYVTEQRAAMRASGAPAVGSKRAFKCGPAENAQAWAAMTREFFGGFDAVPSCPP